MTDDSCQFNIGNLGVHRSHCSLWVPNKLTSHQYILGFSNSCCIHKNEVRIHCIEYAKERKRNVDNTDIIRMICFKYVCVEILLCIYCHIDSSFQFRS